MLVYYGPALLQLNQDTVASMRVALAVLSEVYRCARLLWSVLSTHSCSRHAAVG